jgi:hypothetical protein
MYFRLHVQVLQKTKKQMLAEHLQARKTAGEFTKASL